MYSPLEQFEILAIIPLQQTSTFYLAVTNSSIFVLIIGVLSILYLHLVKKQLQVVPSRWQVLLEILFTFSKEMVESIIGKEGLCYFPLILYLFYFLVVANLIGMIPYSFTITSHIFITFALALFLLIGITITGLRLHKLQFLGLFLPSGSPLVLAPLFVGLELMSYMIRVISLSVRLFANLMAGHSLLKILAGFAWTMLSMGGVWTLLQFVPICIIIAVTGLELAIAFVQAYVFSLLTCLYLNDVLKLH